MMKSTQQAEIGDTIITCCSLPKCPSYASGAKLTITGAYGPYNNDTKCFYAVGLDGVERLVWRHHFYIV